MWWGLPPRIVPIASTATCVSRLMVEELNRFEAGTVVTQEVLEEAGLIKQVAKDGVKVLGNGELKVALTVVADKFTKSAVEKIEAAGGKAEVK